MNRSRRQFLQTASSGFIAGVLGQQQSSAQTSTLTKPLVASVRFLGKQFLDNPVGVTGADGATSTPLPSGESLWLFGDTVEGPFKSIRGRDLSKLSSNTAAIVPRQDASGGIQTFRFISRPDGKRPRQLVPFAANEDSSVHRVWPIHGVCIGKKIYVFYHRISLLKDVDVFVNFKLDGMGIARAEVDVLEFARLTAPDGTREYWKGDQPSFGVFIERIDDYVYLWGSLATGMYLARTRPRSIDDLNNYEYLVESPDLDQPKRSPRWSKTFQQTAKLFDSVPNEMSAAYNPYLRQHMAFHSLFRENKIIMRTAPQITGPWSAGEVVYRPERITDTDLIYAAKEHPELARDGGRILYVTFVNSATYVPQLIEVTLK